MNPDELSFLHERLARIERKIAIIGMMAIGASSVAVAAGFFHLLIWLGASENWAAIGCGACIFAVYEYLKHTFSKSN